MYVTLQMADSDVSTEIVVDRPRFVIGRAADCDLQVCRSFVSRHHCELRSQDKHVTVHYLGSRNWAREMSCSTADRPCCFQPLGNGILGVSWFVGMIAPPGCKDYHNMRCRAGLRHGLRDAKIGGPRHRKRSVGTPEQIFLS